MNIWFAFFITYIVSNLTQCQIGPLFFPLHYFQSFSAKKHPKQFLQIDLFSFCAKIEPKLSKLGKIIKIHKKNHQKSLFSDGFLNSIEFGLKPSAKNHQCYFHSIVPFFCHLGHYWSCESRGVITTFVSFFNIFQQ